MIHITGMYRLVFIRFRIVPQRPPPLPAAAAPVTARCRPRCRKCCKTENVGATNIGTISRVVSMLILRDRSLYKGIDDYMIGVPVTKDDRAIEWTDLEKVFSEKDERS